MTFRRLLVAAGALALLGALAVGVANTVVLSGGGGGVAARELDRAPRAQAALVLGALVHEDGEMSAMLADRVRVAAALYRAGKVDRVLVSGDHGRPHYDEVNTMRRALIRAGVPDREVFTDHAGFDTWTASCGPARSSGCAARSW